MALDELRIVQQKQDALEAARARRAECAEAMTAVERAAAAPSPGRERAWRSAVRTASIGLKEAFIEHVAVAEAPGGLFEEVTRDAPRLIQRTRVLADEHATLARDIDGAIAALDLEGFGPPIPEVREDILALLTRLSRHRQAGSDLVYESLEVDIGGGGD